MDAECSVRLLDGTELNELGAPSPILLPPEIIELIFKNRDWEMLIKARRISRSWLKKVDAALYPPRPMFIDVMRVEVKGNTLHIQMDAMPFKFAFIMPILRSGEHRTISVGKVKEKKQDAPYYFNRVNLSCKLSDLSTLTTLMSTFPVRVYWLQSMDMFMGKRIFMLDDPIMSILERLFEHWKIIHTAVCVETGSFLDARFMTFMDRTEMLSAYKYRARIQTGWRKIKQPFTRRTPIMKPETLVYGTSTSWVRTLTRIRRGTLPEKCCNCAQIEFGDEFRSIVFHNIENNNSIDFNRLSGYIPKELLQKVQLTKKQCLRHTAL
ncbi:hypothetical protein PRIPAC_92291, partial [Pristionchus pacificus]